MSVKSNRIRLEQSKSEMEVTLKAYKCPLCCEETFESMILLQSHLNQLIPKLLCPECNKPFLSISDLNNHLEIHLHSALPKNNMKTSLIDGMPQIIATNGHTDNNIVNTNLQSNMPYVSEDIFNEELVEEEIRVNCDEISPLDHLKVNGKGVLETEIFTCSSCNMEFADIDDHLQMYHSRQEVLFKNEVIIQPEKKQTPPINQPIPEIPITTPQPPVPPGTFIESQEIVDSNGAKYTRKLVHIEKFWDKEGYYDINGTTSIKITDCVDEGVDLSEPITGPIPRMLFCTDCICDFQEEDYIEHECKNEDKLRYKCTFCKASYNFIKNFRAHMKSCHKDAYHAQLVQGTKRRPRDIKVCDVCSAEFTTKRAFNVHLRTHQPTPKKARTKKKTTNVNNNEQVKETKMYQCTVCETVFKTIRTLRTHLKNVHNCKEGPYTCLVCNTEFATYKSFTLHSRMHSHPARAQKIEPPVRYGLLPDDSDVLDSPDTTTTSRTTFACKYCHKEYDEEYRKLHMQVHSGTENFYCEICNRKFFSQSLLDMHMMIHSNDKTHVCKYCKQILADYDTLQQHIKDHLSTRPYQCNFCGRRFIRPHEKVKHERIHTGEKPHVCELCGKAFRVSYCLTLHMRSHSGTRPYPCNICWKRFKSHSVYNHHMLLHQETRNFKCPYCEKLFKTAVQLAGHKNTHTKPFTCTDCNRPFASLYGVRTHMECHRRDNNLKFNCEICGASYARAFALKDHIKTHQATEWIDPNIVIDLNQVLIIDDNVDLMMDVETTYAGE